MREYVMAILCSPVTASDLQVAEKNNSVFIIRKLDFSEKLSAYLNQQNFESYPFKLMFVFSNEESIVVRDASDEQKVKRKLAEAMVVV